MEKNSEKTVNIKEILNSFDLELLRDHIDYFKKHKEVQWSGGPQENGVIQFAYPIYPEGMDLLRLLKLIGGFDYEYDKHVKEIVSANLSPSELNLTQIQSYLTYIVRGEKFCDGHIAEHMKNGVLLSLCLRLDNLARLEMTKDNPRSYNLDYITKLHNDYQSFIGSRKVEYIKEQERWILSVQLDENRKWFLKVIYNDNGEHVYNLIECKEEYLEFAFGNEAVIREQESFKKIVNSHYLLLDQLMVKYTQVYGIDEIRNIVKKYSRINDYTYYRLKNGLIFRINQKKMECQRLNFETSEWEDDISLFVDFEHGNIYGHEEINFEDINYIYGMGPTILLGRSKECDIQLSDPTTSRKHALIFYDGVAWVIKDLNSKNGILVNGKKVTTEVLYKECMIQIGSYTITFNEQYLYINGGGKILKAYLANQTTLNNLIKQRKRDLYLGCLIGGAIGDACGYEWKELYKDEEDKKLSYFIQTDNKARISDDTQMTLFAANAIIYAKTNKEELVSTLKSAYEKWKDTQNDNPKIDQSKMWIFEDKRLHKMRNPDLDLIFKSMKIEDGNVQYILDNVNGSGSVMRAAPLGLAVHYDSTHSRDDDHMGVTKLAVSDAMLTHGHPSAIEASTIFANLIFNLVQYKPTERKDLVDMISLVELFGHYEKEEHAMLRNAVTMALDPKITDHDAANAIGAINTAIEVLSYAVFCAIRYQNDFEKAIYAATKHQGYRGTTATICGNILGAWYGADKIKQIFDVSYLELSDVIDVLANDLYECIEEGVPELGKNGEWDQKYRR